MVLLRSCCTVVTGGTYLPPASEVWASFLYCRGVGTVRVLPGSVLPCLRRRGTARWRRGAARWRRSHCGITRAGSDGMDAALMLLGLADWIPGFTASERTGSGVS